jgi:hypothetical protein
MKLSYVLVFSSVSSDAVYLESVHCWWIIITGYAIYLWTAKPCTECEYIISGKIKKKKNG